MIRMVIPIGKNIRKSCVPKGVQLFCCVWCGESGFYDVVVVGGRGNLNGSFLKAGIKMPVGRPKLLKVKKLENDVLWLRYKVR